MPTKILKRINEPARTVHFLMRELLVYSLGWADIESNPLGIFEAPLVTGVDGETLTSQPNRFRSGAAPFIPGHVGMWLTVYGSEFANNGVYRIIGVPSPSEVVLEGGVYGASFVDDINVQFRVVDPTLNAAGTNYFVLQGIAGSSAPLWQARLVVNAAVTDTIDIEVSPQAGWVAGWSLPVLPTQQIQADATQSWYVLVDDTHVRMWTQNTAGTAVFQLAYFGGAEPRRPASDDRCVISFAGNPSLTALGALANIQCLDDSLSTAVVYSALTYGDSVQPNMFTSLPPNQFDLRNDSAKIPIGTDSVGFEEDDRAYLRGVRYVSDQIPYRSFVDNGRLILSLGNGLAVEWDGSLSR